MKKHHVREILISGVFFAGFLLGILFVNLWGNTYLKDYHFLDEDTLTMIRQTQVDARSLFFYVLLSRGKCFALFWLLGYTILGIPAVLLLLGWLGFSTGVFGCLSVIHLHLVGVLFYLAALLPQVCFYAPMVWMAAGAVYDRGVIRFQKKNFLESGRKEKSYTRTMLLCLALLLPGAALESCVNPWLLKQTVEYFLMI